MRKKQTSYVPCPETISLILMNTKTYKEKQVDQIDTYIGEEGNIFLNVGHSENLASRDSKFSYSSYMKVVDGMIGTLLECFFEKVFPQLSGRKSGMTQSTFHGKIN